MERRIVTQLMTCMDESYQTLSSTDKSELETSEKKPGYVLVIGATNRPDALDPALRRPGRFDREIAVGIPDENARLEILSVLAKKCLLEGDFNLMKIARSTPGFVGADLKSLVNKAGNLAMKRIMDKRKSEYIGEKSGDWLQQPLSHEELKSVSITMSDFEEAAKLVQPSLTREGFSSIPDTKWEDVGGLNSSRKEFDRYIVQPIKKPEDYEELGLDMAVGFLLYGPPGCGKSLIAKAVANEAGANFIHIKGPEVLDKLVGESELKIRSIFSRARACSPCIVFFDEIMSTPGPSKRRRAANFVWKQHMTVTLFQFLVWWIEDGSKGNKWKLAAKHISEAYNVIVTLENVSNHIKSWRQKWSRTCRLRNLSGTSWDENDKTIIMGEEEAQTYIEAHPDCVGLLNKPIPYYDELAIICGNDIATGAYAVDEVGLGNVHAEESPQVDVDPSQASGSRLSGSIGGSDGMLVSSMRSKGRSGGDASKELVGIFASALTRVANVMQATQEEDKKLAKGLEEALDELVGATFAYTTFDADFIMWANDPA